MTKAPIIIGAGTPPPNKGKFIIAVPGHRAPVQRFDLPNGVTGRARISVAQQQLADRLGGAASDMTVVPMQGGAWSHAIVCSTNDVQSWRDMAAARDTRCIAILPDMLTLPAAEGMLVLRCERDTLLARAGFWDGFAAPVALAAPLLERLVLEHKLTHQHVIGDLPATIRADVTALDLPPAAQAPRAVRPAVDLRRALDTTQGGAIWPWAAASIAALLAFGIWAATLWTETQNHRDAAAQTRAATVAILRDGLIPSGPILDVRQQVAQAMEAGANSVQSGTRGPVDLLSRASVGLFGTNIDVGQISFDGATSALTIAISADRFATIDALVDTMRANGLDAAALDMRDGSGGGVTARLRLAEEAE